MFASLRQLRGLRDWFAVRAGCARCEYLFEREPGYFLMATWGTVYFPATLLGVALMFLLPLWVPLSENGRIMTALLPAMIFAVLISRHGRLLFLIVDHAFDPLADEDRKNYRIALAPF